MDYGDVDLSRQEFALEMVDGLGMVDPDDGDGGFDAVVAVGEVLIVDGSLWCPQIVDDDDLVASDDVGGDVGGDVDIAVDGRPLEWPLSLRSAGDDGDDDDGARGAGSARLPCGGGDCLTPDD